MEYSPLPPTEIHPGPGCIMNAALPGDFRSWESPQTLPALFIGPFELVERFQNLKFAVKTWEITPIDWDTGCAIFLGYFFGWKINFWVYFLACNKFLGQDFRIE